jgi:protoporphyrinogen oxidase
MEKAHHSAIIIGAGPAGLTAAFELLERTDIRPIVLEADSEYVGGISKTVRFEGNRIDIGGHRFFSKSNRVMDWWFSILRLQKHAGGALRYQGKTAALERQGDADPEKSDDVFLVRPRQSRIYYNGRFFDYPITLSISTLAKLGPIKVLSIGITYVWRRLFPRRPEVTLEDFFVNRFGDELYRTFFKTYTEKVWGVPCDELSAEWGAQRVKGLSISKVIMHAFKKFLHIDAKKTETSLIEWFIYPKHGPGALWESVARKVQEKGGEIRMGERVVRVESDNGRLSRVVSRDKDGKEHVYDADYVFSTMPIAEFIRTLDIPEARQIHDVSDKLVYRDFFTVGLLLDKKAGKIGSLTDNWIYVHDPQVDVGRIQIFNNWSPYMVEDPNRFVWVGLEYFCNDTDEIWKTSNDRLVEKATAELAALGLVDDAQDVRGAVVRQPKAYPAYTGTYGRFAEIRTFLDTIPNLFCVGRNGMHRYNNQDHSMLASMTAVDFILGNAEKASIWDINTEEEYHETK